jgi:hypothetical protein
MASAKFKPGDILKWKNENSYIQITAYDGGHGYNDIPVYHYILLLPVFDNEIFIMSCDYIDKYYNKVIIKR